MNMQIAVGAACQIADGAYLIFHELLFQNFFDQDCQ